MTTTIPNYCKEIDGSKIKDFESFHDMFKFTMGFPDFYGNNMNAWIDCMGDIHNDNKMTTIFLPEITPLTLTVKNTKEFIKNSPEVFLSFIECVSFINNERLRNTAPINIVFK